MKKKLAKNHSIHSCNIRPGKRLVKLVAYLPNNHSQISSISVSGHCLVIDLAHQISFKSLEMVSAARESLIDLLNPQEGERERERGSEREEGCLARP